jgi:hypothetical protein
MPQRCDKIRGEEEGDMTKQREIPPSPDMFIFGEEKNL